MGLKIEEIKRLIKSSIPDAEIDIQDLAGDNNHYSATIKSKVFSGKSKIEQHKLVYKALNGKMGSELHALSLCHMPLLPTRPAGSQGRYNHRFHSFQRNR